MEVHTARSAAWLRLEGAAALGLSVMLYAQQAHSWWLFAALLLVPDLAMLGYARGARVGALAYNLAHTYTVPLLLAAGGLAAGRPLAVAVALVWTAHVGLDRLLGYGLKQPTGFRDTHLGRIGRDREGAAEPVGVPRT